MNKFAHKSALFIVASMAAVATSTTGSAAESNVLLSSPYVDPGFAPEPILPKFGFTSSNIGFGERVLYVRWGGRAARFGLEPGDVILSMNGFRLNYSGAWNDALYDAMENGGWVRLRIRDVRTGYVVNRQLYVGSDGGPINNYYKSDVTADNYASPGGPVMPKSTPGPKNGIGTAKSIK